ncbi:MAG: NYN domain-containing protein [Actinomycetes bacterium]
MSTRPEDHEQLEDEQPLAPATPEVDNLAEDGQAEDTPEGPGLLPDAVRQRVVALASEGLGAMSAEDVPASLRPLARFTPSKRARLAATPLAAALENDAVFRQRLAERVRQKMPDLATALSAATVPPAADPLDVAAVAYLLRPDGWLGLVAQAGRRVEQAAEAAESAQAAKAVSRLEEQLTEARTTRREEVERVRAELKEARAEAHDLRRRLKEARDRARQAEAKTEEARIAADDQRVVASKAQAASDTEVRRLRSRLMDVEGELEAARRAAKEGRSVGDMRMRLLLDTLVEAAQGLRRELALPPLTSRPADTVSAVTPSPSGPQDVSERALAADDPALLDQLLRLPQVHLVVDGYNVTKSGFGGQTLEDQRSRLLSGLAVLAAQTGAEVTCVFDGAALDAPVPVGAPRGVRVRFSPPGTTADEVIRRLVRAEPEGRPLIVVSDDREVADGVRRSGARPCSAAMLLRWLERA